MIKRTLVTGGTGFVGANLIRRLLHDGHEVHLLVRPEHSSWRIQEVLPLLRLHTVNLADNIELLRVLEYIRPDWIFHLATHGAYSWQSDAAQIVRTNILGTINLLEAALKVGFESFINTGSSSEYGSKDHAPNEDEKLEPNSYYAVGKASASLYCCFSAQHHNVHIPTLRLYSVYGPYEESNRLISSLIQHGLKGNYPPLTNPHTARDFVYTDDVSEAFIRAATQTTHELGAIYNVGSGVQTSLQQAVEVTRQIFQIEAEPQWGTMANRGWDTDVWVADNHKIQNVLGWKPQYSFEEGFRQTIKWFREHRHFYN